MLRRSIIIVSVAVIIAAAYSAFGTNGDNLIGIGPISRSMGGVGLAAPQDSVTAVFNNPAALNACPCGVMSEMVFGGTVFDPHVKGEISTPGGTYSGDSQMQPFVIPAIGVSGPLADKVRYGLGAYGVSGMGVDYRGKGWDLDGNPANGYEGDIYTKLEIMKFAGMLSYDVNESFSVGGALQMSYNNLDFGQGSSHDYALGLLFGVLYRIDNISLAANYVSPEKAEFRRVYNFDEFMGSTTPDTLTLESPASYGVGIAVTPTEKVVIEFDTKYVDWANADGYKDFDWKGQWVFGIGAQYMPSTKLALRIGYNYGQSPVEEHNGWDPSGVSTVQGKSVPTMGYEMLRVIGFPAVVEHHLTLGIGYQIAENVRMNLGFIHAFENTIDETSAGGAINLKSDLSENSYDMSFAWAF